MTYQEFRDWLADELKQAYAQIAKEAMAVLDAAVTVSDGQHTNLVHALDNAKHSGKHLDRASVFKDIIHMMKNTDGLEESEMDSIRRIHRTVTRLDQRYSAVPNTLVEIQHPTMMAREVHPKVLVYREVAANAIRVIDPEYDPASIR